MKGVILKPNDRILIGPGSFFLFKKQLDGAPDALSISQILGRFDQLSIEFASEESVSAVSFARSSKVHEQSEQEQESSSRFDSYKAGSVILEGIALDLGIEDRDFCKRLCDWGDIIRKTFYDGGIEEIISTRRLVHIVRAYSIFNDKAKAIQVCVNRFDDETKQAFLELYDKIDADFQMPSTDSVEVLELTIEGGNEVPF